MKQKIISMIQVTLYEDTLGNVDCSPVLWFMAVFTRSFPLYQFFHWHWQIESSLPQWRGSIISAPQIRNKHCWEAHYSVVKGLSLKFAKKCLDTEKFKDLFPENPPHQISTRKYEKYQIPHCLTERMKQSGLMHMKYQLNRKDH